jgi:phosphoribosylanthranilate isomerase
MQKDRLILSGGINPANILQARELGCWAIDVNSGVETSPGIKDPVRLRSLFSALRGVP